jgi:hypothetical protein
MGNIILILIMGVQNRLKNTWKFRFPSRIMRTNQIHKD